MNRIEREKATIKQMIELYCRHKEKNAELCDECDCILRYACQRLDACRYGNRKSTCKKCPIHCYAPAYRIKIRTIMRYSGPRMLLYHPFAAIRHWIKSILP